MLRPVRTRVLIRTCPNRQIVGLQAAAVAKIVRVAATQSRAAQAARNVREHCFCEGTTEAFAENIMSQLRTVLTSLGRRSAF